MRAPPPRIARVAASGVTLALTAIFVRVAAAVDEGGFIEYAHVHNNMYGTSIAAVRAVSEQGKTCLLDIDVQGAELVKKTDLHARFLFVAPPKFDVLEQRLRGRGTETEDKIKLRLENARGELLSPPCRNHGSRPSQPWEPI